MRLHGRHRHRGPHGREKINRSRLVALILVTGGFAKAAAWASLIVMYLIGLTFTHELFRQVWFVALLSLYANAATDFGQACASLAQLVAGDAHQVAEETHRTVNLDLSAIERDLHALARMHPGDSADMMAENIARRLGG